MKLARWSRFGLLTMLLLLVLSVTAWAVGGFTHPIPGFAPQGQHFVTGSSSNAGPGWVWYAFDVSGPRTGEPDKLAYNPATGQYVLVITDHYQFSGFNGATVAPGDCWVNGYFRHTGGQLVTGAVLTIEDLDRDGALDVFAYAPTTGAIARIYFRSFGGCDWTDAF